MLCKTMKKASHEECTKILCFSNMEIWEESVYAYQICKLKKPLDFGENKIHFNIDPFHCSMCQNVRYEYILNILKNVIPSC